MEHDGCRRDARRNDERFDTEATEEIDAYLAKIGVKRSAIMEAFRGPAAPNNPVDLDIAAAHLGVTPAEKGLIFTANTAQQFQYWGEATNAAAIAANIFTT